MAVDVSAYYNVTNVRRIALNIVQKGESSDIVPEDNFSVFFEVADGKVLMTVEELIEPVELPPKAELMRESKAQLVERLTV